MKTKKHFTAFAGFKQIASGDLKTLLTGVWEYLNQGHKDLVLIFDDATGSQVDYNLQGSLEEVLTRAIPPTPPKGPGRPKLGVVCREISLLPRHWEWLDSQPRSASGTLRRLVETARKQDTGSEVSQLRKEAAGKFIWSVAGNLEGFEEASRALYADNSEHLEECISRWPEDIKRYLKQILEA